LVDGAKSARSITEGRVELEFESSVLFRWVTTGNSVDSFANVKFVQRANSLPYATKIYEDFVPTTSPKYFLGDAAGRVLAAVGSATPTAEAVVTEVSLIGPGVLVVLIAICAACCCVCCCKCCKKARKQRGNSGAVPLGDINDDAVPPVYEAPRMQHPVQGVQYGYYWPAQ
jgi:hypothetical protein